MNNIPLHINLTSKPYPKHQSIDEESVIWLINKTGVYKKSIDLLPWNHAPFPIDKLNITPAVFDNISGFGIHGIRHQLRVALYVWLLFETEIICDALFSNEDKIDLMQAAIYHDIGRKNDNSDILHGKRSAIWLKMSFPDMQQFSIKSVAQHADNEINGDYDTKIFQATQMLKAADALDRFRFPKEKWWPNPRFFTFEIPTEVIELCKYVTIDTEKDTISLVRIDKIVGDIKQWLKKEKLV